MPPLWAFWSFFQPTVVRILQAAVHHRLVPTIGVGIKVFPCDDAAFPKLNRIEWTEHLPRYGATGIQL